MKDESILAVVFALTTVIFMGIATYYIDAHKELSSKIAAYEELLKVVDEDHPGYVDDVLSETDAWSEVYN